MLNFGEKQSPDTTTCLLHPYFWTPGRRLTFLQDASDRFEIMCRDPRDANLVTLEENASGIVGHDWHSRLDRVLIDNLGKFRKYDGKSVQDLLRALRNKVSIGRSFDTLSSLFLNFQFLLLTILCCIPLRNITTKTSLTTSSGILGLCRRDFWPISRVGFRSCSFTSTLSSLPHHYGPRPCSDRTSTSQSEVVSLLCPRRLVIFASSTHPASVFLSSSHCLAALVICHVFIRKKNVYL
jgi:hypothetical protein